jgi:porphobilinogen synthase
MSHHDDHDHDHCDCHGEIEIPGPGFVRPRRLRRSAVMREMVAETRVYPDMLCTPHFVLPGSGQREEISAMPGILRESPDLLLKTVESDLQLGLRHVLLFGHPATESTLDPDGPVPTAVRALKTQFGHDLLVSCDICLCVDTDNDALLDQLAGMASICAEAGADIIAPSDMMDGRVAAIRVALDMQGMSDIAIMSYAAKYASGYYGPCREAAGSAPSTYEMDPRNVREALREVDLDEEEGADIIMVKPALAYLDVIRAVRECTDLPVACYNVSGEFSMVKAAAKAGYLDEARIVNENLHAMARAGANILITYHGREALRNGWLR